MFKPVPIKLKRGEAVFHHPLAVHGSLENKYRAMDDEYYRWNSAEYFDVASLGSCTAMSSLGHQLGVSSSLWEWFAGSGRLSTTARAKNLSHLPPCDYRWGINIGFWHHQITLLWNLLMYPVDVLFAAPSCTPWS